MTCSAPTASFSDLAAPWQAFVEQSATASIFVTPRWQEVWWQQFGGNAELCLFHVGPEHAPLGFAPLMRSGDTLRFIGDSDLFDYHDFVRGPGAPEDFYDALADCLRNESWRSLVLTSLVESSPTLELLPGRLRDMGCDVVVEVEDVVPGLDLPASWEDYLGGLRKKDRHELRRKLRRLDDEGPHRLVETTSASLVQDAGLFLDLMRESMEEKRDFMVPDREAFFRHAMADAQDAGWLRLFFLELRGERVAAALCFDLAGRRLLYNSGYRLAKQANSVSLLLKALTIQQAIEEGLHYYDFLRGGEQYKFHLGAHRVELFRLQAVR